MVGHSEAALPRVITLNVGGYHFVTTLSTLTKDKDSMLATMFSGRHELDTDGDGRYFIDRDGTHFKDILNYLRDSKQLPSADRALEVYKEAQFYQIEGLIDTLERFSNVFAHKLEEAKKSKLGCDFEKWQQQILICAQNKSLENLTSSSKVSLLSQEDHKKIMECGDCVGPHAHSLIVSNPAKRAGSAQIRDTLENVQRRVKETEPVVCPLKDAEMKTFVAMTMFDLMNKGYAVSLCEETIQCKNTNVYYGIGREECHLNITEHVIEFEWCMR
ncbi:BTB/POZ domain-containing protein KCTD5-like isoform X1 [Stylophora pistillata]|uniref:BTB/POZ domain-containing protein KCTD5-like isoform X1 n=1 Tax=Stylophora pistillata TaxID=50429 RepID=UPI000C0462A3|nr:BTB/POZ domain-containing protein KCTD5-like isoform X1 [Stylophora pistillata]